jgi:putative tryptophan/tyrosine transport system substrate-binding protein
MRRRKFLTLLGGAAAATSLAGPRTAQAQRQEPLPLIGYLSFTSPSERPTLLTAFQQGLEQAGYVAGRNVAIQYRSADGHYERLPELVAELIELGPAVIAATGGEGPTRAAIGGTKAIPIVFTLGSDPVKAGIVESFRHPGGNATGVSLIGYELDAKRLQLLHELVPKTRTVGVLASANNPSVQPALADMQRAAQINGQHLVILDAGTPDDLDSAFASLQSQHIDAVVITTSPFYEGRRQQLVALAERYAVPVVYPWREYSVDGGLISYGTSFTESYRQAGLYVGRILKGEKPGELPVVQATKFELVVNLKTAKKQGIDVPTAILLRADEVIE